MGQRDPLVEYQREGFDMFNQMMDAIKEESVGFLFNVEVQIEQPVAPVLDMGALVATGPGEGPGEVVAEPVLGPGPADDDLAGFEPAVEVADLAPVEAHGVAAAPVASEAPAAYVEEQSLEVEQSGDQGNGSAPSSGARGSLPTDFGKPERPAELQYTAPTPEGGVQTSRATPALDGVVRADDSEQSRNALCACGSGKKFKRCHGDPRNG